MNFVAYSIFKLKFRVLGRSSPRSDGHHCLRYFTKISH